ncbi:hypothetical protein IFM89_038887 [Coptis chinensis]|uniref:protein-disulfide reductase n=1 Tax=Coptis chinensis TaxID=261450 RepID=A0A835J417_9MAGN|nr:hypothetical protein IFM89_038887 [Coptis chinensis]
MADDIQSLLSSSNRDFLVRNNGDQVKINDLSGKTIGLYFSASWCGPCRRFTPKLIEVYNELSSKNDIEIVFVSADRDDEAFNGYFSKMPWLAIPLSDSDSETGEKLNELFGVDGIPCLVIIDGSGKVLSDDGAAYLAIRAEIEELEARYGDLPEEPAQGPAIDRQVDSLEVGRAGSAVVLAPAGEMVADQPPVVGGLGGTLTEAALASPGDPSCSQSLWGRPLG